MSGLRAGKLALQALILVLLGACAGGGGGGGGGGTPIVMPPPAPPPPPVTPPPPGFPSTSSDEYNADWAVAGTNAVIAWQHGANGQGIKIGVIDDGIVAPTDPSYAELAGRVEPASKDIITSRNQLSSTQSHGSELSALMVGNFNGNQTVGLAFGATVLAVRADDGHGTFDDSDLAAAINYAVVQGVKVINLSLGSSTPASGALVNAITNATAAGVIFAISAGNEGQDGASQVNYPAFYASNLSVSHGLIMIGGGLNPNGTVNTVSNPPGGNANYYLTAPGWQIIVPDFGPPGAVPGFQVCGLGTAGNLCRIQGTSYASPQIAGAVALLMQAFPGLTPTQVVDLLFTSADDTGPAGVDTLNGRGRLNIGRAFQPIGDLAAPITSSAAPVSASSMLGSLGPAFGDGFANDPGEWTTAAFDYYGRNFPVDFSRNWVRAFAGPALVAQAPTLWRSDRGATGMTMMFAPAESVGPDSLRLPVERADLEQAAVRIEGDIGGFSLSFASHGASTSDGRDNDAEGLLGFVNADSSLRLSHRLGRFANLSFISESGQAPIGLAQQPASRSAQALRLGFGAENAGVDVTYGQVSEEEGLLGLAWTTRLGDTPGSAINFVGLSGHWAPTPRLRLTASGEIGEAEMRDAGWLKVDDPLRTTAFSLEAAYASTPDWLERFGGGGEFRLSMAQPLRVEAGTFSAQLPMATNYGRSSLYYENRVIDPTPSGRELRFALGYHYFDQGSLSAFAETMYVLDPGHVADADPETLVRLGVRVLH